MFSELDETISKQEIVSAIKKLNSGKSGGPDRLLNEFFIYGIEILPKYLSSYLTLYMIAAIFLHIDRWSHSSYP